MSSVTSHTTGTLPNAAASMPIINPAAQGVPLLDVQRQYRELRDELMCAIQKVCDSGRFILGPECEQLERAIAQYCRVPHAIACASGSDALLLALMALEVGPGDEVLLPSYTFFATASAVWRLGAKPVFVDIDPVTFNLDADHAAALTTSATKAIIPVHLYGQCADMRAIGELAQRHGFAVIEDACQAIGAEFEGRRAGSIGDIGCLSFYPTKNLGGFGDGGLMTAVRDDLAVKLRLLRTHGMQPRYYHQVVGINSRLDTLQAAVLAIKLPHLDRWTQQRESNARRYTELFKTHKLDHCVTTPRSVPGNKHVWNQYVIRVGDGRRDALREHLTKAKIGTEIYYPVPLHQQVCFKDVGYKAGSLPQSERAAKETLALPIFPELTPQEQATVVEEIARFFRSTSPATKSATAALKRPAIQRKGVAG